MRQGRALSISLFAAYVVSMVGLALSDTKILPIPELALSDILDAVTFFKWLGICLFRLMIEVIRFMPLGFMAAGAFPGSQPFFKEVVIRVFFAFPLAAASTVLIRGLEFGKGWHTPGPLDLVAALVGVILGIWIARNWMGGIRKRLWLIPKLGFLFMLFGAGAIALVIYGTDSEGLKIEGPPVTAEEKQAVWSKIVKARLNAWAGSGSKTILDLTADDLSVLLRWSLSTLRHDGKSRVDLDDDQFSVKVTGRLPRIKGHQRYFNLDLSSELGYQSGNMDLRLKSLKFGLVELPDWSLGILSGALRNVIVYDRRVKPLLDSTELVDVDPQDLTMIMRESAFVELANALEMGSSPELDEATNAHMANLLKRANEVRSAAKESALAIALKVAFDFAKERSVALNPITENKAALLALNAAFGEQEVVKFLDLFENQPLRRSLRGALGEVLIWGRNDWAHDFFLSSAITISSSSEMSERLAIFKEQFDHGRGGSRVFSVADVLVRKAGARFAKFSTESEQTARTMQDRMTSLFSLSDYIPPISKIEKEANASTPAGRLTGHQEEEFIKQIDELLDQCKGYKLN